MEESTVQNRLEKTESNLLAARKLIDELKSEIIQLKKGNEDIRQHSISHEMLLELLQIKK